MSFFELSYYILIAVLFLMATVFLVLPLPKSKGIETYSLALKLLSLSYAVLGTYCAFKWAYPIDILGLPFLLSATLEAHLLGLTYINVVNSNVTDMRYVVKRLVPPMILAIVCTLFISSNGYHHVVDFHHYVKYMTSTEAPDVWVRTLWFFYYTSLPLYYSVKFFRESAKAKRRLENYTSENNVVGLNYINYSFFVIMGVAVDSVCITLCPIRELCTVFNFVMLILYVCVGMLYIKSLKAYLVIQQAEVETEPVETPPTADEKSDNWKRWRDTIIENEIYLQTGLTIVQLAQDLNTNRSTLSAAINQNEGKNFNAFINSLRIEKAQELMRHQPQLTLADVCEQTGYSDQANFSRHFKELVGVTPAVWRQENCQ